MERPEVVRARLLRRRRGLTDTPAPATARNAAPVRKSWTCQPPSPRARSAWGSPCRRRADLVSCDDTKSAPRSAPGRRGPPQRRPARARYPPVPSGQATAPPARRSPRMPVLAVEVEPRGHVVYGEEVLPHHVKVSSSPDDTHWSSDRRRAEIKRGAGIAAPEPPDRAQAVQQRKREQASRTVATSIRSLTNRLPNSGPQYPRCNSRPRPRIQPRRSPSRWGLASRSPLSPHTAPAWSRRCGRRSTRSGRDAAPEPRPTRVPLGATCASAGGLRMAPLPHAAGDGWGWVTGSPDELVDDPGDVGT